MAHSLDHRAIGTNQAFVLGIALNLVYVAVETGWGLAVGSLALLADAGHNLGDVLSLVLALGANLLAGRRPTARRTYGLRRATILAALLSAILLLLAVGAIAWEAVGRFGSPTSVPGRQIVVVASIGVVINTATALLFRSGGKRDLNVRGAFLHMAADAAVSLGVVLAGFGIVLTGWTWLDPAISLAIVVVILASTWGLLRDSVDLAVDAVPKGIDPRAVERYLADLPGVTELHDLHIWALSTTESALTAHLVIPDAPSDDSFLVGVTQGLQERFGIEHPTIQLERGDFECEACAAVEEETPADAQPAARR